MQSSGGGDDERVSNHDANDGALARGLFGTNRLLDS